MCSIVRGGSVWGRLYILCYGSMGVPITMLLDLTPGSYLGMKTGTTPPILFFFSLVTRNPRVALELLIHGKDTEFI